MKSRGILLAAVTAGGIAIMATPTWVWAQEPEHYRPGWGSHMMGWGGGGYGMIFGPLFMILMLAAVIATVVLLVRWLGGPWQGTVSPHHLPPGRTPLDILKERFARGEIDKDEFEERRRIFGD